MSTFAPTFEDQAVGGTTVARDARQLLGQVMGYVALTVGFAALGAYLGRDLSGATGLVFFIGSFATIIGLNVATAKGREQLALALLFGLVRLRHAPGPLVLAAPALLGAPRPDRVRSGRRS